MKQTLISQVYECKPTRKFPCNALLLICLFFCALCGNAQYMITFTAVDSITRLTLPECEIQTSDDESYCSYSFTNSIKINR